MDAHLVDSDDSSDEEVLLRTGNVPQKWYELYDHIGYSVKGQPVGKTVEGDELDEFIKRQKDPKWWMEIKDYLNNKNVRLTKQDLEVIKSIRAGTYGDPSINPEEDYVDFGIRNQPHTVSI